jgi:trimethylguanosine synthase
LALTSSDFPCSHVASDLSTWADASKTTIIDIFAGAGGNAIAFALSERWERVIAVERNASVLACAKNNAAIYGVLDKITWIHDDCFKYISQNQNHSFDTSSTVIFASPPWGGPGYSVDGIFDLSTMQPYSVEAIHGLCKGMNCALYLPRTSDLRQLARLMPGRNENGNRSGNEEGKKQNLNGKMDVVHYCVEGASKALVAYIPATAVE